MTKDYEHIILGVHAPVAKSIVKVKERVIWRSYRSLCSGQEIYMYLGFTMDDWSVNDIYKHHWFLVNGEKIMVNNYSLKLLREIDYQRKL